jgi:hypothetical protein
MNYSVDNQLLVCPKCDQGREVCTFCWFQDWTVFKSICDCGLVDQGEHTIPCEVVGDEEAHANLRSDPRLDAEAERGGESSDPVHINLAELASQPDVMEAETWTSNDDAMVEEFLAGEDS